MFNSNSKRINPFVKGGIKRKSKFHLFLSTLALVCKIALDLFMVTVGLLLAVTASLFGMLNLIKDPVEQIITNKTDYQLNIKDNINLNLLGGANAYLSLGNISLFSKEGNHEIFKLGKLAIKIPTSQFATSFNFKALKIGSLTIDNFELINDKTSLKNLNNFIAQISHIQSKKVVHTSNNRQVKKPL